MLSVIMQSVIMLSVTSPSDDNSQRGPLKNNVTKLSHHDKLECFANKNIFLQSYLLV
jgi:hypothetical protein